jgi:hypothetical protein
MDKAKLKNKIILWHLIKRRENTNMDRHLGICLDCNHQEKTEFKHITLHFYASSERKHV